MRRRQQGESVSDSAILMAHPELATELETLLRRLRFISRGPERPAEDRPGMPTAAGPPLNIRCPRCTSAVPMSADTEWDEYFAPHVAIPFRLVPYHMLTAAGLAGVAHFELHRPLGAGSFGEVWEAHDTRLDRLVAVKLPHRSELSARDAELFLREARAACAAPTPKHRSGVRDRPRR